MMKNKLFLILCLISIVIFVASCSKEDQADPKSSLPTLKTTLTPSSFNYWTTCGTNPYGSGSNIIVPLSSGCGTEVDAAQQKNGQNASNISFYGTFIGGTGATSYSEESVFVCDNVTSWNGNEMGYVKTLNDNYLKAYVQGGGQYYTAVISSGNNGWHTYKASASAAHKVDFYVDNVYKTSLTNNSGTYTNRYFYFVATNHWAGGSGQGSYSIQCNSMNVW